MCLARFYHSRRNVRRGGRQERAVIYSARRSVRRKLRVPAGTAHTCIIRWPSLPGPSACGSTWHGRESQSRLWEDIHLRRVGAPSIARSRRVACGNAHTFVIRWPALPGPGVLKVLRWSLSMLHSAAGPLQAVNTSKTLRFCRGTLRRTL